MNMMWKKHRNYQIICPICGNQFDALNNKKCVVCSCSMADIMKISKLEAKSVENLTEQEYLELNITKQKYVNQLKQQKENEKEQEKKRVAKKQKIEVINAAAKENTDEKRNEREKINRVLKQEEDYKRYKKHNCYRIYERLLIDTKAKSVRWTLEYDKIHRETYYWINYGNIRFKAAIAIDPFNRYVEKIVFTYNVDKECIEQVCIDIAVAIGIDERYKGYITHHPAEDDRRENIGETHYYDNVLRQYSPKGTYNHKCRFCGKAIDYWTDGDACADCRAKNS